jgi:hypothetical protein
VTVAVVAVGVLLFQGQLWRVIAWATAGTYLAYQMVVFGALIARAHGWPQRRAYFNLGRWGWPVNVAGFIYGAFMIVNLSWPRSPGSPWYDNYLIPLSTAVIFALGGVMYFVQRARGINVGRMIRDMAPDEASARASPETQPRNIECTAAVDPASVSGPNR